MSITARVAAHADASGLGSFAWDAAARPKAAAKAIVIGSTSVRLHGGTKKRVEVHLNHLGKALVAKDRRLAATVEVTEGKKVLLRQAVTFK